MYKSFWWWPCSVRNSGILPPPPNLPPPPPPTLMGSRFLPAPLRVETTKLFFTAVSIPSPDAWVCARMCAFACVCVCEWVSCMLLGACSVYNSDSFPWGEKTKQNKKRTAVTQSCSSPIWEEEGCHPGQNFNMQQPFSPEPSTFAMCPHNQDKLVATVQFQDVTGWRPIIS